MAEEAPKPTPQGQAWVDVWAVFNQFSGEKTHVTGSLAGTLTLAYFVERLRLTIEGNVSNLSAEMLDWLKGRP